MKCNVLVIAVALPLVACGNEQAKKFIAALTKTSDIKVAVTGARSGDSMTVSKIELQ